MMPPAPRNRNVAPMSSGATSWTLRLKKDLQRRMGEFFVVVFSTANRCTLRRKILYYPHMRIFLAGATGVIGRRLTPLLALMGHEVTGTTRSPEKAAQIEALSARPVVVDVFDADGLTAAVKVARPDV